jgi:hypothetical protein
VTERAPQNIVVVYGSELQFESASEIGVVAWGRGIKCNFHTHKDRDTEVLVPWFSCDFNLILGFRFQQLDP